MHPNHFRVTLAMLSMFIPDLLFFPMLPAPSPLLFAHIPSGQSVSNSTPLAVTR
jgi:hypothetical protein